MKVSTSLVGSDEASGGRAYLAASIDSENVAEVLRDPVWLNDISSMVIGAG